MEAEEPTFCVWQAQAAADQSREVHRSADGKLSLCNVVCVRVWCSVIVGRRHAAPTDLVPPPHTYTQHTRVRSHAQDAVAVVKKFMERDPQEIRFNLV